MDTVERYESDAPGESRKRLLRWGAWFSLANTLLLLLVAVRYVRTLGWPEEWPARIFLVLSCVGHFAAVAMIPWLLLAGMVLAWPSRRAIMVTGILLSSLLVMVIVVDSVVFNLYRFHLNGMVWSLIRNGGVTEILPLSFNTWAVTALLVVMVVLAEMGLAILAWKWVKIPHRLGRYVIPVMVAIFVAGQVMHVWADATHYTSATKLVRLLPAYKPLTAKRIGRRLGWVKERGESAMNFKPGATALHYPLEPVVCQPPSRPLNLMIIVIDGWRFDMLNEAAAPNLWRLSQQGLRFERHCSAANTTRFGIFSLFYGLYGTYWHAMLAEQRGPVLIGELDRAGYQFGVFASARLTGPEFDRTVFSQVSTRIPLVTPGRNAPEKDLEINRRMMKFLDCRDRTKPFFGFLFYDSTHAYDYPRESPAPFQPAAASVDHLKLNQSFDPVPVRNRYRNAVHFVDSLTAQIIQRLEQESLLENTVVLVTGDHGEEFNETGKNYWGHNGNFSRYQTQVPLVAHWPGKAHAVVSHITSHLDIAPTLLKEMLNCSVAFEKYSNGQSLFDPTPRVPLLSATWDRFALASPGRIDVMFNAGYTERFDEEYREISSSIPRPLMAAALEGMSRFYAR